VSKLNRLLCYESQHKSQGNEKSLVQFEYEKAVSNYLGTQSTFNTSTSPLFISTILFNTGSGGTALQTHGPERMHHNARFMFDFFYVLFICNVILG